MCTDFIPLALVALCSFVVGMGVAASILRDPNVYGPGPHEIG